MTPRQFKDKLLELEACEGAFEFCEGKSLQEAWDTCPRGDWMLWLFMRSDNYDLQLMTLTKGHCANTIRHLMKDERSIAAVDAAIAFGEGRISRDQLDATSDDNAFALATSNAIAIAAYGAAYASSSSTVACATAIATYLADFLSYDALKANQKQTADICRKYLPVPIFNQ